ncbi:MAG: sugar phosphate nucleotidyltransferase [Myxococcota bacterium]
MRSRTWAIVLAGGEGSRLSGLTTTRNGVRVPKQFCSLSGGPTLLRQTLERAAALVPREQIVVVVADQHRDWWQDELADLPRENILEQPANRGTAAGILLPALAIARIDPAASVVVLPSDHHVGDEATLRAAFRDALDQVALTPERIALLGVTPDAPDAQYGWIVPQPAAQTRLRPIELFVEKPPAERARELMARGGLWSSFLFACRVTALLDAFEHAQPELLRSFLSESSALRARAGLSELYASTPVRDFSRDVLERVAERLGVLAVPACGWSDLGTPERVASVLAVRGSPAAARGRSERAARRERRAPVLSLALAWQQAGMAS